MTANLTPPAVTVSVSDGSTSFDVSDCFVSLEITSNLWDESGWWKPKGTLRLANVAGLSESLNCRTNPTRWRPGNQVTITVGGVTIPWMMKILRYPTRPWAGNQIIEVELGSDADFKNFRQPEGNPGGIAYGTPTDRGQLIKTAVSKAGLAFNGTIGRHDLDSAPDKSDRRSWLTYAGQVAFASRNVLWQRNDGEVISVDLTLDGLTPLAVYTVGEGESAYEPEDSRESPPETVRVTGTAYSLDDVQDQVIVNTETVINNYENLPLSFVAILNFLSDTDTPTPFNPEKRTVRTTTEYRDRDTNKPYTRETIEQELRVILPEVYPSSTRLEPSDRTTKIEHYDPATKRLNGTEELIEKPIAVVFPSRYKRTLNLVVESRVRVFYAYDNNDVVVKRTTVTETAIIAGVSTALETVSTTIERWQNAGGDDWIYTRTTTNAQPGDQNVPTITRRGSSNQPPTTQYRKPSKSKTEEEFTCEAKFRNELNAGDYGEKLWSINLPGGMVSSKEQCCEIANLWGRIRHGRQFTVNWAVPFSTTWLNSFTPVRRIDFIDGSTRTSYLVDGFNLVADERSAAIGGKAIEIGQVALDGTGTPSVPYVKFISTSLVSGAVAGGVLKSFESAVLIGGVVGGGVVTTAKDSLVALISGVVGGGVLETTSQQVTSLISGVVGGGVLAVTHDRVANLVSGAVVGGVLRVSATDPSFANVSLLLPLDGANNSTTFTDVSNNGFTVTRLGSSVISTAQSVFGGASLYLPNTSPSTAGTDGLQVADNAAFEFPGDFTLEARIRISETPTGDGWTIITNYENSSEGFSLQLDSSRRLTFNLSGDGIDVQSATSISLNTWTYVAVRRSGSTVTLHQGTSGSTTQVASVTNSTSITGSNLIIGGIFVSGFGWFNHYKGYIDDLRITKGVARDVSVVPTEAFPTS
jgi:hypothetical protein